MRYLTFICGQSFRFELVVLISEAVRSSFSKLTDGEKACVFRYLELPALCTLLVKLCVSKVISLSRSSHCIMSHGDSGEPNDSFIFSDPGRSSSKELLH